MNSSEEGREVCLGQKEQLVQKLCDRRGMQDQGIERTGSLGRKVSVPHPCFLNRESIYYIL